MLLVDYSRHLRQGIRGFVHAMPGTRTKLRDEGELVCEFARVAATFVPAGGNNLLKLHSLVE